MTIASEITKLENNLVASYTAAEAKGATMPTDENFDNLATCIGSITQSNNTTLNVTPTISAQNLTPSSPYNGFNSVNVSAVTSSIDQNITAENIKSGVSILGVTGTHEDGILEALLEDIVAGNNPVDTTDLAAAETQIAAFLSI